MSETADTAAEFPDSAQPAAPLAQRARDVPRLHYLLSYSFIFQSSRAFSNLVLASVCMVIPIIGPIVLGGYQYEIVAHLHRRDEEAYPDFDFSRFGDYLTCGVWKFLAGLITSAVMMPVFFALYICTGIGVVAIGALLSQNNPNNPGPGFGLAAAIVVPLSLSTFFLIAAALQAFTTPLILKASLSGDAASLFDLSFAVDFIRRTWKEMILEMLWIYVTAPIVALLGLLVLLVGIYPAIAMTMLADAHTNWQLYEIYLARGGQRIRLKVAKPAPVVALRAVSAPHDAAAIVEHCEPGGPDKDATSPP